MISTWKSNLIRGRVLVIVALASVLIGMLLGSGIAMAHMDPTEKVLGWEVYEVRHSHSCGDWECDFKEKHTAYTNSSYTVFDVDNTYYTDATADDDVRFANLYIWDEFGEHSVLFSDFFCNEVNGIDANVGTEWYWAGHDPTTYGTSATQYLWHDDEYCGAPAGAGTNATGWHKP